MSIIDATALGQHIGINDGADIAKLTAAAAAACRNVQGWCGRSFDIVTGSTSATARYFHVLNRTHVFIDDCTEITAVASDSADAATWATTLTSAEYYAGPLGGINSTGRDGWPYDHVLSRNGYLFYQNTSIPALKVTAKWGWVALPDDVRLATLMVGAELHKTGGGSVEQFTADGQFIPIRRNALVRDLLQDYRGWRAAPSIA